jgi:uncharacterized repeat protein (TIGR01451 family)
VYVDDDIAHKFRKGDCLVLVMKKGFNLWVSFATVLLFLLSLPALSADAATVDPSVLEMSVVSDGVGPFNGDNNPGNDSSASNGIVRSFDDVTYEMKINVNWVIPTVQNFFITSTLPAGMKWNAIPKGCLDPTGDSNLSVDKTTLICQLGNIDQGTAIKIIGIANAGAQINGTNLDASFSIQSSNGIPTSGNSNIASVEASAFANIDIRKGSGIAQDGTATGRARGLVTNTSGEVGYVLTYPIQVMKSPLNGGKGSEKLDSSIPVRFTDDYSDIITKYPNAEIFSTPIDGAISPDFTFFNSQSVCGPITEKLYTDLLFPGFALFADPTANPAANASNSAVDSGTWDCTFNLDNTIDIEVSGFDSDTFPTDGVYSSGNIMFWVPDSDVPVGNSSVDNTISFTSAVSASGTGITSESNVNNNKAVLGITKLISGTLPGHFRHGWLNDYGEFRVDSQSDIFPYQPNNQRFLDSSSDGFSGQPFGSNSSYTRVSPLLIDGNGLGNEIPDGVAIMSTAGTKGSGSYSNNKMQQCVRWDNSKNKLTPSPSTIPVYEPVRGPSGNIENWEKVEDIVSQDPGAYVWISSFKTKKVPGSIFSYYEEKAPLVEGTDYIIEYAHVNYSSDSDLDNAKCYNSDSNTGSWEANPTLVPGGVASVNAVRVTLSETSPSDKLTFDVFTKMEGSLTPGTIVPYFTDRAVYATAQPNPSCYGVVYVGSCSEIGQYDPVTNSETSGSRGGDRLTITSARVKTLKTSGETLEEVFDGEFDDTPLKQGDHQEYRLFTRIENGTVTSLELRDGLLSGLNYDVGSAKIYLNGNLIESGASADPTNLVPVIPGSTVLSWTQFPVALNVGDLVEIRYTAQVANNVVGPTDLINVFSAYSPDITHQKGNVLEDIYVGGSANGSDKTAGVGVQIEGAFTKSFVSEATSTPVITPNEDIVWQLNIANKGTNTLTDGDFISVLPFNGDVSSAVIRSDVKTNTVFGPAAGTVDANGLPSGGLSSNYAGTHQLSGPPIVVGSTANLLYTSAIPNTIEQDPLSVTNQPAGTTVWCAQSDFGNAGCPTSFANVTAVRFNFTENLLPGQSINVQMVESTAGNSGCVATEAACIAEGNSNTGVNTYVNDFGGRFTDPSAIDGTTLWMYSNDVSVQVVSNSIGNFVWLDGDADGIQDVGEVGIGGVVVELRDAGGALIDSVTTNPDGSYLFTNLPNGEYTVTFVPPVDHLSSPVGVGSNGGIDSNGLSASVSLNGGTTGISNLTIDSGFYPNVVDVALEKNIVSSTSGLELGDTVDYEIIVTNEGNADATGVEVIDTLPAGLIYVSSNGSSTVAGQVVTWVVGDLDVGESATLLITAEINSVSSLRNFAQVSVTNETDIDSSPGTTVKSGDGDEDDEDSATVQVGLYSIGNFVWLDGDADGIQDVGEVGIGGVVVELRDAGGALIDSVTTNPDGSYLFTNLPNGEYTVTFVPPVDHLSSPVGVGSNGGIDSNGLSASVSLNGADNLTVDSGFYIEADKPEVEVTLIKKLDTPVSQISLGSNVNYTIQVSNKGPNVATNVKISDYLPAGLSFISANSGGVFESGVVVWNVPSVGVGKTVEVGLVAKVTKIGSVLNTAEVSGMDQINANANPSEDDVIGNEPDEGIAVFELTSDNPNQETGGNLAFTGLGGGLASVGLLVMSFGFAFFISRKKKTYL